MFAPKVAKPQTKATADPTNSLTHQCQNPVVGRLGGNAVEQARMLQGTIGNQATLRYLTHRLSNAPAKGPAEWHEQEAASENMTAREEPRGPSWDFSKIPVFPPDRANRLEAPSPLSTPRLPGIIQPKLVVGSVNDPLEQEADRVADQVMRMSGPAPSIAAAPPQINRKCVACEEEEKSTLQTKPAETARPIGGAPPIVHEALRSPGQPLDPNTRAFMESRFGHDFSGVRIHADQQAASSARVIGASAYALANHVAFGANRYDPYSDRGRRLLAHELTHVLQQKGDAAFVQRDTGGDRPTLTKADKEKPEKSPHYIDNLFTSVSPPSMLNGATTFYWGEKGAQKKITIPLTDLQQDDSLFGAANMQTISNTKAEALKANEQFAKDFATPGYFYYSFYVTPDGVIMPTAFSKVSTPNFHALWPDLKRMNAVAAADIAAGLRELANSINPFPCTEVDEKGNLTASINLGNCALPILLHAHSIHSATHGSGTTGGSSLGEGEHTGTESRTPPKKSETRTAKDVISSESGPLQPGKTELGQYGIDKYSTFSNRPKDKFAGHELLQNLWLEVKGYGKRLVGPASRNNPAIALTQAEHTAVGREQSAAGLFDRQKLSKMSADQVIEANAQAMKRAGVPDYVVETLKKEAQKYAATLKPPAGGSQ